MGKKKSDGAFTLLEKREDVKFKTGDRVRIKFKGKIVTGGEVINIPTAWKNRKFTGTVRGVNKYGSIAVHRDGTGKNSFNFYFEDDLAPLPPEEDLDCPPEEKEKLAKRGAMIKTSVLTEALLDIVEFGLRADLNPSMDHQWSNLEYTEYMRRIDQSVRDRARQALEKAGYYVNVK